jgi:hypothetical protein
MSVVNQLTNPVEDIPLSKETLGGQNTQQMNGDDDRLVDEILDELNEGTPAISEETNINLETTQPNINNPEMLNAQQFSQDANELPPIMNVEYDSPENTASSIKNMLKKPIIVLCISFVVFNPLVLNMLRKYMPSMILNSIFYDQIQTLLFSVLVAVLFLGTNYLI